jgi:hypothetical protein
MPGPLEGITVLDLTRLAQVEIHRLREKGAIR